MLLIESKFLLSVIYLIWLLSNFVATESAADPSTTWPKGFTLQVYASNNPDRAFWPIGWVTVADMYESFVVGEQHQATHFFWENNPYFQDAAGTKHYIYREDHKLFLTFRGGRTTNWIVSDAQMDPLHLSNKSPIIGPSDGGVYGCDPSGAATVHTKLLYVLNSEVPPCKVLIFFRVRPI